MAFMVMVNNNTGKIFLKEKSNNLWPDLGIKASTNSVLHYLIHLALYFFFKRVT